jgi:hypothetical protein
MITLFDALKTFIFCILAQYKNDKDEIEKFNCNNKLAFYCNC